VRTAGWDRDRLKVLSKAKKGLLTQKQAAQHLDVTERHTAHVDADAGSGKAASPVPSFDETVCRILTDAGEQVFGARSKIHTPEMRIRKASFIRSAAVSNNIYAPHNPPLEFAKTPTWAP
jgi:hypothetical protein